MPALANIQQQLDALRPGDEWGVQAASMLLAHGAALNASDLHFMSTREALQVSVRVEGLLRPVALVPAKLAPLLIARLKVLAGLPAFNRHEPQDGRLEWRESAGAQPRILRLATIPTIHGENLVIRFPEAAVRLLSLGALGMTPSARRETDALLSAGEGVILVTGPSGSGKTTTLYALLRHLHESAGDRLHFLTIEDPVERELSFAAQVQVNELQGLSFHKVLRAALRQDPNVLLVGEIRDPETARITMQAGMSGHLVFSTLHSGRAARVYSRLLAMGIEPFHIASATGGAIAQRLLRCASGDPVAPQRVAIFEVARTSERIREMILSGTAPDALAREISASMSEDMRAHGRQLLEDGAITREELEFALGSEPEPGR